MSNHAKHTTATVTLEGPMPNMSRIADHAHRAGLLTVLSGAGEGDAQLRLMVDEHGDSAQDHYDKLNELCKLMAENLTVHVRRQ